MRALIIVGLVLLLIGLTGCGTGLDFSKNCTGEPGDPHFFCVGGT